MLGRGPMPLIVAPKDEGITPQRPQRVLLRVSLQPAPQHLGEELVVEEEVVDASQPNTVIRAGHCLLVSALRAAVRYKQISHRNTPALPRVVSCSNWPQSIYMTKNPMSDR